MLKIQSQNTITKNTINLTQINTAKPIETNIVSFNGNYCLNSSQNILSNYNKAFISFKGSNLPEVSFELIQDLTSNPRKLSEKASDLQMNNSNDFYNWLNNTYKPEYDKYVEHLFNNASSIEELIKFRPDWQGARLEQKFYELNPEKKLTIGELPANFGNNELFESLITHINNTIKAENNPFAKNINIPDFIKGDNTFQIKPLAAGQTSKGAYLITNQNNDKFVLKIDSSYSTENNNFDKCDSVALGAMIDYYLTANNCENCTTMFYYTAKENAALYEYIEGDHDQSEVNKLKNQYGGLNSKLVDLNSLGISFNDTIGQGNIIKQGSRYVMVDSGHCTYYSQLMPKVNEYQKDLPNNLQFSCFMK